MINAPDEDEVGGNEINSNKTNLSNQSILKKSTGTSYLTFESAKKSSDNPKKGGSNSKKDVKAIRGSNYLILDAKKTFNHL